MYLARGLVQIKSNSDVSVARPVGTAFIVLFDNGLEVKSMFPAYVFYTKIIYDKREGNGTCFMYPQTRHKFRLEIASLVESFFE